jgi:two-component system, response regulator PdtaR
MAVFTDPSAEADRPLILVCDDEALIVMLAHDALDDAGYRVLGAPSASEAFMLLEHRADIALVFSDVDMPGDFNGLDLARRALARWPRLPVVLTSGKAPIGDLPVGATFLAKPYHLDDLVDHVSARLSGG